MAYSKTRMLARLLVLAAFALTACVSAPPRVIEDGPGDITAFSNVTVITEYGGPRLVDQTVVVRGDRIEAIAPAARLVLPGNARVIDGQGRLLAPGLADMHVHYFNPEYGALFLANGITTVRDPSGGPNALSLAASIAAGDMIGPRIYPSGQLIDGPTSFWGPAVTTDSPEAVRRRVRADAAAGLAAIKLYAELSPEQFAAGVEEARALGLRVYAHVPRSMTLAEVMAFSIDSIEHLDAFDRALGGEGPNSAVRWASVDQARMASLASEVAASGVWNAPTLIVLLAPSRAFADIDAAEAVAEMRYADAGLRSFWRSYYERLPEDADLAERLRVVSAGHDNRIAMLSALRSAGAPLLIGTDTPNPYVMPGFALHEEFAFFAQAGFTPAEILRIASKDAAQFVGETDEFGLVAEGARADLILLDRDPETNLAAIRQPAGVMAAGRWYDAEALANLLEGVAQRAALPAQQ